MTKKEKARLERSDQAETDRKKANSNRDRDNLWLRESKRTEEAYDLTPRCLCKVAVRHVRLTMHCEGSDPSEYEDVLRPRFIKEEFNRIYFGQWQHTKDEYLNCTRIGRGDKPLQKAGAKREIIYRCIQTVNQLAWRYGGLSFTHRRAGMYSYLRGAGLTGERRIRNEKNDEIETVYQTGEVTVAGRTFEPSVGVKGEQIMHAGMYDHLFVDELQDCTPTDFQTFYRLLKTPNHLVVAGDLAQAVHLGLSATGYIPRDERSDSEQKKNVSYSRLTGSYRLPFRIGEALVPLSRQMIEKRKHGGAAGGQGAIEIDPYRGAPPGARPIFVYAEDEETMAEKIAAITAAYGQRRSETGFDLQGRNERYDTECLVLERDSDLRRKLCKHDLDAYSNSVLEVKGLEKKCVVWSTREDTENEGEICEFAYTILTRASRLLIIALFPTTRLEYKSIIGTFDEEDVILWDRATEDNWCKCRRDPPVFRERPEEAEITDAAELPADENGVNDREIVPSRG
jgi:hypothetical protein